MSQIIEKVRNEALVFVVMTAGRIQIVSGPVAIFVADSRCMGDGISASQIAVAIPGAV